MPNTLSMFRALPNYPTLMIRIISIYLLLFAAIGLWGYFLFTNDSSLGKMVNLTLNCDEEPLADMLGLNCDQNLVASMESNTLRITRSENLWTLLTKFVLKLEDEVYILKDGTEIRVSGIQTLRSYPPEEIALLVRVSGAKMMFFSVVSVFAMISLLIRWDKALPLTLILNIVIFTFIISDISNVIAFLVAFFSALTVAVLVFDNKIKAVFGYGALAETYWKQQEEAKNA